MTQKTAYDETWKEYIPEQVRQDYKHAHKEFRKSMEGRLTQGLVDHRRNTRHQMLLAWRNMIDYFLKKIDKPS